MAKARCDLCGQPYYRRNLVESWGAQNPGHRIGWSKSVRRICIRCQGPSQSQRLLTLATLQVTGRTGKARPRGSAGMDRAIAATPTMRRRHSAA